MKRILCRRERRAKIFSAILFVLISAYAWAAEPEMLFSAASTGSVSTVERWLRGGGSPNIQDKNGNSALLLASENGHVEVARLLLEHGAVVDLKNNQGYTPLFCAVQNRHPAVLSLLLANGADPRAKNNLGTSPEEYVRADGFGNIRQYLDYLQGVDLVPALGLNSLPYMKAWQKTYYTQMLEKRTAQADITLANAAKTDPDAMYLLGMHRMDTDPDGAVALLEKAAVGGNIDAMYHVGKHLTEGDNPKDPVKGFGYLKTAADAKDLPAMALCGACYLMGTGVRADNATALSYLEPAAKESNADALYYMGYMKLYGIGIPMDASAGMEDITAAASMGSVYARQYLRQSDTEAALLYLKGYPERHRGEIKSYMLSLGALPASGPIGCDIYDVATLFDRAYGVHTITLCYTDAQVTMTFTLYAETKAVFRERLIDFASQVPVEFVTEK